MLKNVMLIVFIFCSLIYSEVSHTGLTGTNIHTVYRWQFADSAARVNQSVVAADTMKLAYQRSDSTSWILVSTSGIRWKKVAYASNQNTLTTSNVQFNNVKSVRDSTSDLIVTDSIKGVTGTFSGALTGTTVNTGNGANELYPMNQDVQTTASPTFVKTTTIRDSTSDLIVTDSIKGVTGTFSGALTGTTVNTGNGANELYPMDQGVRSTDPVGFLKVSTDSIRSNPNIDSTSGNTVHTGNYTMDGCFQINPTGNNFTEGIRIASSSLDGYSTVCLGTSGTLGSAGGQWNIVKFPLVNGAGYKLHYNNRYLFDIDTNGTVTTKNNVTDSIKLGTGSYLKTYLDTTFYDSLYDGSTYLNRGLARIVQIGNIVTLYQPSITGTTTTSISVKGIPTKFRPVNTTSLPAIIRDNGNINIGMYLVNTLGSFSVLTASFGTPSAGTSGTSACCVSWLLN